MNGSVETYLDAGFLGTATPTPVGTLHFDHIRGGEVQSFEHSPEWLETQNGLTLDPDLQFFSGRQYLPQGRQVFGFVADTCPDRWGRTLMQRQEAYNAAREKRTVRTLLESDYLLGVCDEARMGALRYRISAGEAFLAVRMENSIPPWVRLRELEAAARSLELGSAVGESLRKDLDLLLAPGSSLGGARPKATVQDEQGGLWIAKFPSSNDLFDVGLAEALVYELARSCGLNTTETELVQASDKGSTFLAKRFDRKGRQRVHFASAMTFLGKTDGDNARTGISYLEIAEAIRELSCCPRQDLHELFKRIVFSIAISNTDDHLRNHGFLLGAHGWGLSPLFDVNPNPYGRALSLNISEFDNRCSFRLALSQAQYFDYEEKQAQGCIRETCEVVAGWEAQARRLGMDAATRDAIRPAFKVEDD